LLGVLGLLATPPAINRGALTKQLWVFLCLLPTWVLVVPLLALLDVGLGLPLALVTGSLAMPFALLLCAAGRRAGAGIHRHASIVLGLLALALIGTGLLLG
jgi:hypothetical protein